MSIITTGFHTFLYQPILNALVALYFFLPVRDLGLAIIALTVIMRVAFYPLTRSALRSQGALQEIQPRLQAIREKHKNDPQTAGREMMALYREQHINPFGGIFPILIQLPVLFALFRVFLSGLTKTPELLSADLYAILPHTGPLSSQAFGGLVNLTEHSLALAGIAGAAQFLQSSLSFRLTKPKENAGEKRTQDMAGILSLQMRYLFPVMTVVFAASLPAGIALYWVVTTCFSAGQQFLLNREREKRERG